MGEALETDNKEADEEEVDEETDEETKMKEHMTRKEVSLESRKRYSTVGIIRNLTSGARGRESVRKSVNSLTLYMNKN